MADLLHGALFVLAVVAAVAVCVGLIVIPALIRRANATANAALAAVKETAPQPTDAHHSIVDKETSR